MGAIAAWSSLGAPGHSNAIAEAMMECLGRRVAGGRQVIGDERASLALGSHEDEGAAGDVSATGAQHGQVYVVADARLDNSAALRLTLGLDGAEQAPVTAADVVLEAFRRWGPDCAERLLGEFSFIAWDASERLLLAVTDRFGTRPLYYASSPGGFAVASEIKAVIGAIGATPSLDRLAVAQRLMWRRDEHDRTLFQGVRRLPPAHVLVVRDGRERLLRYWTPSAGEPISGAPQELAEELYRIMSVAVQRRLPQGPRADTMLSGGLDSSGIAAICTEQRGSVDAFASVFDAASTCDERQYISALAAHLPINVTYAFPERLSLFQPWDPSSSTDEPLFGPLVAVNHSALEAARQAGAHQVLDGFGGDETVSYGLNHLTELAASLRLVTLARTIHSFDQPLAVDLQILRHRVLKPLVPRAAQQLRRKVLRRAGAFELSASILSGDLREEVREAMVTAERSVGSAPSRTSLDELISDLTSPVISYAFTIEDRLAGLTGVEKRYPYFDQDLVDFSLRLPGEVRVRDGHVRWVQRQAMRGRLPDSIRLRRDKAEFSQFVIQALQGRDREIVEDVLRNPGQLAAFCDMDCLGTRWNALLARPSVVDATSVWRGVALGLWLRRLA